MATETEVVLVSMPFAPVLAPSLALGLLKAALLRAGIKARTHHFSLRFAEIIGGPLYAAIADETQTHDLVGEWVFSDALFHHQTAADVDRYVADILRGRAGSRAEDCHYFPPVSEGLVAGILRARGRAEDFLAECAEAVVAERPRLVGFSSIFQQQVASLALARRVKELRPEALIVFGGANCEGALGREVMRQFPFLDAVVSGEGDQVFPELARRALRGEVLDGLQGVYTGGPRGLRLLDEPAGNTPMIRDLDELPFPDYDDYFEQWGRSSLGLGRRPQLLFESSRGCWWGAKHHCTFCGLNGETMAHRSKSADRVLAELDHLAGRHPGHTFYVVDNILDMNYFKGLIPALARQRTGVDLFYEVKANLRKEQVRQLREAGIGAIQPGIESLSDQVLTIMRKGVRALQNIQLLKWCEELGVAATWNFLWGFPGESAEEYRRMAELVPLLTHLPPPNFALTLRIDRFSPNFNQAAELGFTNIRPYPAYYHVYPLPPEAVTNLAYYFTFEYKLPQDLGSYVPPLAREITNWQECHRESRLYWIEKGERLLVWDWRPIAVKPLTVLTGLKKAVYLACDEIHTARQLHRELGAEAAEIRDALEELTGQGLMLCRDEAYLALAVAAPGD